MEKDDEIFEEMMEEIKRLAEEVNDAAKLRKNIMEVWEDKSFTVKMSTINMLFFDLIWQESDDAVEAAAYVARMSATMMRLIDEAIIQNNEDEDDDEEETLQ